MDKKFTIIQLLKGAAIVDAIGRASKDETPFLLLEMGATALADRDTLKKTQLNPSALDEYIDKFEALSEEESAETLSFFMKKSIEYSASMIPSDLTQAKEKIVKSLKGTR